MRILLVTTSYPASRADGSEAAGAFVRDFAGMLARKTDLMVVCPGSSDSIEHGDPVVARFGVPHLPLGSLNPISPLHWPAIARTINAGSRAVERACSDHHPDHIFALWALPSGWWARRTAFARGIGYSVWALGSDIWGLGRLPLARRVLRGVLRDSANNFADGIKLCSDVSRISGGGCTFLPSSRMLCQSPSENKCSSPPYRLAFLGRWHRNKGVDLLMRALLELRNEDWAGITQVRVHGGGPLEHDVKRLEAGLKAKGRPVEVGGYMGTEEATALLNWADFLIIPSRVESIPVVFSDALQAGCRIISTPVGDLPDLVSPGIGTLAADVSSQALAAAIASATGNRYADPTEAEAIRSRFGVQSAVDELLARLSGGG